MTLDQMMEHMGFPATETGPYVTELRAVVARQISEGVVYRSGGSWAERCFDKEGNWTISHEERARELLAVEWEIQNAHSCRVECVDPIIWRSYNVRTGERSVRVRWHMIPAWCRDQFRRAGMRYRVWRNRNTTNPYAAK